MIKGYAGCFNVDPLGYGKFEQVFPCTVTQMKLALEQVSKVADPRKAFYNMQIKPLHKLAIEGSGGPSALRTLRGRTKAVNLVGYRPRSQTTGPPSEVDMSGATQTFERKNPADKKLAKGTTKTKPPLKNEFGEG